MTMSNTKKIYKKLFLICCYDWSQIDDEEDRNEVKNQLRELLSGEDIDINVSHHGYKGSVLLCEASRIGNEVVVDLLLKHGADVNTCDLNKCSPLYIAASRGYLKIVEKYIEHHADINSQNMTGYLPLLSAVENNHMDVAKALVEAGAEVNINRPNTLGVEMTLLDFVLLIKKDIPFAEMLINAGMRPYRFRNPLNYLLLDSNSELIHFLQKLVRCGFDLYSERWVRAILRKRDMDSLYDTEMAEFLENAHKNPQRLENISRITIRSNLPSKKSVNVHLRDKVEQLPIPTNLKRFVLFEID